MSSPLSIRVPARSPIEGAPGVPCVRCNITFPALEDYQRHLANSERHFHCPNPECDLDLASSHKLARHLGKGGCGLPCKFCWCGFKSVIDRRVHLAKMKACEICHLHHADNKPKHEANCGGKVVAKVNTKAGKRIVAKPTAQPTQKTKTQYKDGEVIGAHATEISNENKGRAMLEKMGWSKGMSLGTKSSQAITEPITQVMKSTSAGLGFGSEASKVTKEEAKTKGEMVTDEHPNSQLVIPSANETSHQASGPDPSVDSEQSRPFQRTFEVCDLQQCSE